MLRNLARSAWPIMLLTVASALAAPVRGQEPAAADDDAAQRSPARDYVIGVEDVLRVVVWGEPELSLSVSVRPDGKITMPLVNDILVEGRTPMQVRQLVAEALVDYINEPLVTVMVERINSFKVYFIGEVNQKGAIPFFRPTRVLQGIATAGGPGEFMKRIWLVREINGEESRRRVDYKKLLAGDRQEENFFLRPGDTLIFE